MVKEFDFMSKYLLHCLIRELKTAHELGHLITNINISKNMKDFKIEKIVGEVGNGR